MLRPLPHLHLLRPLHPQLPLRPLLPHRLLLPQQSHLPLLRLPLLLLQQSLRLRPLLLQLPHRLPRLHP